MGYALRIAPWLWRLHRATSLARVNEIADALHALLTVTIEKWRPLAERAGVPELIARTATPSPMKAGGYLADALGREIRARARREDRGAHRPGDPRIRSGAVSRLTHLVLSA